MAQRLGAWQLVALAGQGLLAEERLQAGRKLQQAQASPHAAQDGVALRQLSP